MNSPPFDPAHFLSQRAEQAFAIEEFCESYYNGKIPLWIFDKWSWDTGEVTFVLNAFRGIKRQDGCHSASHALVLGWMADRYFSIKRRELVQLLFSHDVIEDCKHTKLNLFDHILKRFGEPTATRAAYMTENSDILNYDLRLIKFVEQLRQGDEVVASAEILDRMDELSTLDYLLIPNGNADPYQVRLANKFAKCDFMVNLVTDNMLSPMVEQLSDAFWSLYHHLRTALKTNIKLVNARVEHLYGQYFKFPGYE